MQHLFRKIIKDIYIYLIDASTKGASLPHLDQAPAYPSICAKEDGSIT